MILPTVRFSVELAPDPEPNLPVPVPVTKALGVGEPVMVEGMLEGFPFRAILEKDGPGGYRLKLSGDLVKAVGAQAGDFLAVEVTRVGDEKEVRNPADWSEALSQAPAALALYEQVTPMARREWVRWVASAKQEKTRAHRIEVGIDKLTKGMRRPCCFPGINFVTKGLVSAEETWVSLPSIRGGDE